MSTRHLVHPELLPALDTIPNFSMDDAAVARTRAMFSDIPLAPTPEAITRTEVVIPGLDGAPDVRALLYVPAAEPNKVIVHFHGGGFLMGKPDMNDLSNTGLVEQLGCAVLSVDYRLAPDHPYPAAVDDAIAAYGWARTQFPEAEMLVLGESAGGGLAASLTHRLLREGQPMPKLQALIYPMLDPRSGEDGVAAWCTGEFVWTPASNKYAWVAYLGGAEPDAENVPALAEVHEGLPPTFIVVGGLDLFLEEDLEYCRKLARAGVPFELHVIPGAYHGFDVVGPSGLGDAAKAMLMAALAR